MAKTAPEPPTPEASTALLAVGDDDDGGNDDTTPLTKTMPEAYTLSFENLSVHVPGRKKKWYSPIVRPFKYVAEEYMGLSVQERDPLYALNNITGLLPSGELCLVLGSDDGSKSTLLRALSGRLSEQDKQVGTIALNGLPMVESYQGWRRICPYVGPSDNDHAPVLTVKETFEFARRCTAKDGTSDAAIEQDVVRLMESLGLDHVADTVVGDENLRGISGGQKRRVTVGEMILDGACKFVCLENITDGLSSTDSVKLIQDLANTCHNDGYSAFISLLQPSDDMVELFDKLMILTNDGEMSYFGPVDRSVLREIFLGTDNTDSDKGSIADLVLEASLDKTGESEYEVKRRYDSSKTSQSCHEEIAQLRSRPHKGMGVLDILPEDEYPNSFGYRFKLISARRVKLIFRNAVTFTRMFIAILFGLVIGSLFASTPNNLGGALAKNGYIFLHCFIVLMLSAAVTLPSCFRERATLFKHRSAEFYDSKSSYIALLLTDAPLSILEACLLAVVSYFWVGLRTGAGNFAYFLGMLIALECAGQALGRLLCALYRKQVTANSMSSVIILVFGTVGGFMPSFMSIPPILRWLSWVTPVAYAFEGLMLNEFVDLKFESDLMGSSGNQAAPIEIGGNNWLKGYELPRSSFADPTSIKVFDIFMVFLFALVYDILGFIFIERTRSWYHHQIRRPQATVKKSFGMGSSGTVGDSNVQETDETTSWPSSLIGKNISYSVPLKKKSTGINIRKMIRKVTVKLAGKKVTSSVNEDEEQAGHNSIVLLDHVDVHFRRGRMTCLMGTSGAGKTTLLDVMAGYKTGGTISGEILIDGRAKDPATWKKISGYAEQQDILNPYLSVLETLRFTANCRLPKSANKEEVIQRVIKLMDLDDWSDHIIGREKDGEGLPKHARKRVTIAVELVALPRILFLVRQYCVNTTYFHMFPNVSTSCCRVAFAYMLPNPNPKQDEPTTGLGTTAAASVMNAVRQATDAMGLITVATIHQPSKSIFNAFDDVLLLTKGGRLCYMGESGSPLLDHFGTLANENVPEQCNPADFCLAVLGDMAPPDAQAAFDRSDVNKELLKGIDDEFKSGRSSEPPAIASERPNSAFEEIWLLTKRQIIVQWRNPSYCFMRMASSIIMSLFLGVLFFGDKSQLQGAVFSIGAIFFLVFVLVIPMQATVVPLVEDRAVSFYSVKSWVVLYRETVSGCYSRISYGIGQLIADQPFHAANCLLMFVCFYFLVGFKLAWGEIGFFILMLFLSNWVIQSMGQLYALATPNEESANGLGGLSVMLSVILMGFLITYAAMPHGWKWAYWMNLFHYILQGLVTNELAGSDYHLDLSKILEGVNVDQMFAFDGGNKTQSEQLSSIFALVSEIPDGTNPDSGKLPSFIDCTLKSGCFADEQETLSAGFIDCYLFSGLRSDPPCLNEFQDLMATVNVTEVGKCILDDDSGVGDHLKDIMSPVPQMESFVVPFAENAAPVSIHRQLFPGVPGDTPENRIPEDQNDVSLDFVVCIVGALLPTDAKNEVMDIVNDMLGIAGFVFDVIDQGIHVPGELILFVFGWAEFDLGEGFVAPFKWYYCMFSVAIFLAAIEIFKLLALRHFVWTKR
ncbi:hypothetical protein ACHAXR_013237 [Thalassiosira sp. AJA248-18]